MKAGNDANVAALGEMWQGAAKGRRDVIMVTLGTGVGGGIIVDGKVVAGFDGAGGEIGHITVNAREGAVQLRTVRLSGAVCICKSELCVWRSVPSRRRPKIPRYF